MFICQRVRLMITLARSIQMKQSICVRLLAWTQRSAR